MTRHIPFILILLSCALVMGCSDYDTAKETA